MLHDPDQREATLAEARATAELFAAAGATMFVTAVVVDPAWSPRFELSSAQWDHLVGMLAELDALCAEHGLDAGLASARRHTRRDRGRRRHGSRAIRQCSWCLDTGHLFVGGYDPAEFAADAGNRVAHVHLKDVRGDVAARVSSGALTLRDAVGAGLFCPLGDGDAPILDTVEALEGAGYSGWYVLEQDTDLGAAEPPPGTGPMEAARASLEFLSR